MKQARVKLTKQQLEDLQRLIDMPDDQIDTSDIPEVLDWSDARRGMFYRPPGETTDHVEAER